MPFNRAHGLYVATQTPETVGVRQAVLRPLAVIGCAAMRMPAARLTTDNCDEVDLMLRPSGCVSA